MYKVVFPVIFLAATAYYGWYGWNLKFRVLGAEVHYWSLGLKAAIADFKASAVIRREVKNEIADLNAQLAAADITEEEYATNVVAALRRLSPQKNNA